MLAARVVGAAPVVLGTAPAPARHRVNATITVDRYMVRCAEAKIERYQRVY